MARPKHLVTPVFGFEYPELGAEANVPEDFHQLELELETLLKAFAVSNLGTAGAGDAKKLLIVQGTGAAAWKAMSGDATISEAGAITIANEAVTAAKVLALAITEAKLAGEAVGTTKIANLAITAAKLAAEAVETGKIKNLAVTEAKLAALAVTTGKIAELAVTEEKLATALKERLGITANRAGAKIIAGEEEKNFAGVFGTMTTPDEVPNVVVGEKDLLVVSYQALWDGGPTGNPNKAAIFIGANQIKNPVGGGAPAVQSVETIASTKQWLTTAGFGLTSTAAAASTGAVTTGLTMALAAAQAPMCVLQVAAGTYNVAIKFNGNSARAKERRLYVWTAQFS